MRPHFPLSDVIHPVSPPEFGRGGAAAAARGGSSCAGAGLLGYLLLGRARAACGRCSVCAAGVCLRTQLPECRCSPRKERIGIQCGQGPRGAALRRPRRCMERLRSSPDPPACGSSTRTASFRTRASEKRSGTPLGSLPANWPLNFGSLVPN
jgi:hypothetical protein